MMAKAQKIAFIFPGQGAQYAGMGKDFFELSSLAREIFEEADDILQRKLSTIILEGPNDLLTLTKNSQSGIFVTSSAMLRVLNAAFPRLKPTYCAGLSLGEYSALYASKALSFAETLQLVDKRGEFMNDACEETEGTMAVVLGLDADVVEAFVKEVGLPQDLWVANFNCPGQVVLSGTSRGIAAGTEAAKIKGAKRVLPLKVQGAFHSGLMKNAEEQLAPYIYNAPFKKGESALVMNVPGSLVEDNDQIRSYLIQQVTRPVRWEQGVRWMASQGVDLFVEIGCGTTLSAFNKRIGISVPTITIEQMKDLEQIEQFL